MVGLLTSALLFIGPSYVANAAPLLFGGGPTLDGGRKLSDGQPIFGSHKTIRGVFAGIVAGTIVGWGEALVDPRLVVGGFMISLGAVLGDLLGSLFFPIEPISVLLMVLVTPPVHLATNYGAYRLGIKKTQW